MWYQLNSLLCQFVRFCSKLEHVVLGCVWISLILLKTENNKKIISELLFTQKILFICLFALFMSHEQYKRCWSFKKRKKKRKKKKPKTHLRENADAIQTLSQFELFLVTDRFDLLQLLPGIKNFLLCLIVHLERKCNVTQDCQH